MTLTTEPDLQPALVAGRPAQTRWSLQNRLMARVAGLPLATVGALRCPDSCRWAEEMLQEEESLAESASHLSDLLHGMVNDNDDDLVRRQLLRLRREVFNNRLPQDVAAAVSLLAGRNAPAAEQLTSWLTARRRLDDLRAEGGRVVGTEVTDTTARLRQLAAEDRLRRGVLLASPSLDSQLDAFIDGRADRPGKKERRITRSVLSYLYRTACKPSPFSTLTAVGVGQLAEAADAGHRVAVADDWSSHPRLNVVVLGRLAELVLADPQRRADLPVQAATGWRNDEDRVRFVRRWVTTGDDNAAVTFDAASDRLYFLQRTGVLERMLRMMESTPGVRFGQLAEWLGATERASADECDRYLAALLHLGMIQFPVLLTDVHSRDPLRAFQEALRAIERPWADELADGLTEPISCVDRYALAGHTERRELLGRLRASLHEVQISLGDEAATLPRTLLYEDVRAGAEALVLDRQAWSGLLADSLRSVERILPAFDVTLPQRITFNGYFLARYGRGGRCDDLLKLVHDFHEDFFDQYLSFNGRPKSFVDGEYVPEVNWLRLPSITALDDARRELVVRMREVWAGAADAGEVWLDEETVDAVAAHLTPVTTRFAPQSHFVQLADRPGDPVAVLNQSYGGLSFPFSRFTHCFDAPADELEPDGLAQQLLRQTGEIEPDGAVLAEITGGAVVTNLNLHGRLTRYQIVCPGETSSVPAENQLHLDDLYLEHDVAEERLVLRSHRLGREVIPVYLGYLVPLALPEIPRTLLLLSPTALAPVNLWGGVPEAEPRDGVRCRPRVRHRNLVLSRRAWTVAGADLPRLSPQVADEDWFLAWQRWRRTHGLPDRTFATVTETAGDGRSRSGKPQYVDFASYLSLYALDGLLQSPGARVVFREMLPDEDALHVRSSRGEHVAELAVETLRSPSILPPATRQDGQP
ncbi:lantibiotic dehydratase [Micromonospora chokoriensis]|uniref:lantibiotic dehydratase n=1 Tax=Micromonospora chokoriensis TaxID=356851 RepID=UPI0004C3626B|nr:lantibiotic dehydratase [Micromonospora chokoriensis]